MSHRESDEDYRAVLFRFGPDHRLITCKDDFQWILQRRLGGRWRSYKFLLTREGVLRRVAGLPEAEQAKGLPERFRSRVAVPATVPEAPASGLEG
jgi:hypothetical protein